MTDVEPVVTDFASTGRTGRRNAIPDLLGSSSGSASSAELSNKLAELSVIGADEFRVCFLLTSGHTVVYIYILPSQEHLLISM